MMTNKAKKIRMNTNNIGYMTQNEDKQSKKNKNEHEQHWVHDTEKQSKKNDDKQSKKKKNEHGRHWVHDTE